jgi:TonB family protein
VKIQRQAKLKKTFTCFSLSVGARWWQPSCKRNLPQRKGTLPRIFRSPIVFLIALLMAATTFTTFPTRASCEVWQGRKVRAKVTPVYPEIARRMKLTGIVRLQVVISPAGSVTETKVIGGHPILVTAAVDAVKKWKFDPASSATTGILEINFDPGN